MCIVYVVELREKRSFFDNTYTCQQVLWLKKNRVYEKKWVYDFYRQNWFLSTLESGINVAPWINVAPGKFDKKNKRSPNYTLYY